jgi:dihydroorotase-like cyclic amidohydrolase
MLPYLHSAGVRERRITLERLTEITASAPAKFFGIEHRKGRVEPGFDADLVVLDENEQWTVHADEMHNLNRYTPLDGHSLTGRVRATYVRGCLVYERRTDGTEFFAPEGTGAWVKRERPIA